MADGMGTSWEDGVRGNELVIRIFNIGHVIDRDSRNPADTRDCWRMPGECNRGFVIHGASNLESRWEAFYYLEPYFLEHMSF